MTDLHDTVDGLFRLARWVRGSQEGQCLTYAERVYIAFIQSNDGIEIRPMPDPSEDVRLEEIHSAIEGICQKGIVSAVLAIGDSLLVSSPSATDRVTVSHLLQMGCSASEIAETIKDAHFVLSASLFTAEGCVLSYNATVDSCCAFNKLIGNGDKGREKVKAFTNEDDPPSEEIGDLSAMWWRTTILGDIEEYHSDDSKGLTKGVEPIWN